MKGSQMATQPIISLKIREALPRFLEPFEGRVNFMYLDTRGLVTTAIGCLIDPVELAIKLPWKHYNSHAIDKLATKDEIALVWHRLKLRQDLRFKHWTHAAKLNHLRLDNADVDMLVQHRLTLNYEWLQQRYFHAIDCFPLDAILGILSIAWACGGDFPKKFPKFTRAVNRGDWLTAAAECAYKNGARNAVNRACFERAAQLQWSKA